MIACFSQSSSQKSPGNPAVMLIDLAVALAPVVELAGRDVQPPDEPPGADLGLLRPAPDEIYDLIPRIVRNPDPGQSSPSVFFRATCSAINSARISSLVWIFFSRYAIRSWSAEWLDGRFYSNAAAPFSKNSLPAVEDRRLQAQFIAEVRDGLLLQQMPPLDGTFS